jgi:hypothetical protein
MLDNAVFHRVSAPPVSRLCDGRSDWPGVGQQSRTAPETTLRAKTLLTGALYEMPSTVCGED